MPVKELILASGSPQRKRILRSLKIPFKAIPSDVKEHWGRLKFPAAIVKTLASRKAFAVAEKYPESWVLGVDTLVVLSNGRISGKPRNRKEAKMILKTYPGKFCDIYSGLALVNRSLGRKLLGHEKARLYFKTFKNQDIENYLKLNHWQGSSGAITIERAGEWVSHLKGDYWNVVGLPIVTLKKIFRQASP